MALTLNNFVGFETGGLEEASSITDSPIIVTDPVRTGIYALSVSGVGAERFNISPFESVADAGDDQIVGFAVLFPDSTPGVESGFFTAYEGGTGGTQLFQLSLETDGDLRVDFIAGGSETVGTPFADNKYFYIEIKWDHLDSGAFDLHINEVSKISVSGKDMSGGGTFDTYSLETNVMTALYDDFYCMSGATGTGDFLGKDAEVLGAYQNTAEDATDQGDALEAGTWAITGDTPGVDDGTPAQYTSTAKDGHTICDEGTRSGPNAAGEGTGTIKGGKWVHRLQRGNGGGTTHSSRYGHNGDTALATVALTASYKNFFIVKDDSVAQVPTSSEDFAQGFKVAGAQDMSCADIWAFLLHVSAGAPEGIAAKRLLVGVGR